MRGPHVLLLCVYVCSVTLVPVAAYYSDPYSDPYDDGGDDEPTIIATYSCSGYSWEILYPPFDALYQFNTIPVVDFWGSIEQQYAHDADCQYEFRVDSFILSSQAPGAAEKHITYTVTIEEFELHPADKLRIKDGTDFRGKYTKEFDKLPVTLTLCGGVELEFESGSLSDGEEGYSLTIVAENTDSCTPSGPINQNGLQYQPVWVYVVASIGSVAFCICCTTCVVVFHAKRSEDAERERREYLEEVRRVRERNLNAFHNSDDSSSSASMSDADQPKKPVASVTKRKSLKMAPKKKGAASGGVSQVRMLYGQQAKGVVQLDIDSNVVQESPGVFVFGQRADSVRVKERWVGPERDGGDVVGVCEVCGYKGDANVMKAHARVSGHPLPPCFTEGLGVPSDPSDWHASAVDDGVAQVLGFGEGVMCAYVCPRRDQKGDSGVCDFTFVSRADGILSCDLLHVGNRPGTGRPLNIYTVANGQTTLIQRQPGSVGVYREMLNISWEVMAGGMYGIRLTGGTGTKRDRTSGQITLSGFELERVEPPPYTTVVVEYSDEVSEENADSAESSDEKSSEDSESASEESESEDESSESEDEESSDDVSESASESVSESKSSTSLSADEEKKPDKRGRGRRRYHAGSSSAVPGSRKRSRSRSVSTPQGNNPFLTQYTGSRML